MTTKPTPARSDIVVLQQILKLIPREMILRLGRETGAEDKARSFSVPSHLSAMLFAQLARAISLNDVCDWLRMKSPVLTRFGVTPPSRNTLSHANKTRPSKFIESLFWSTLAHLQTQQPSFAAGRRGKGLLHRFKVRIHAVDSTVMEEVDGERRLMVFLTNNRDWSPRTVCDLYKRRWDIEAFFKQVKQTLKLSTFLGHSANAVRWQVYSALLVYVLLRFHAHLSKWGHSFTRLFAVVRSAVWERVNLAELLRSYGTAPGHFLCLGTSKPAWLPGFEPGGA